MSLSIEIENQLYVKEVFCNKSLNNIENEQWEEIDDFKNYAISNYGRVKSLKRNSPTHNGGEKIQPEIIMKLFFTKQFNKYLNRNFYGVQCSLCSNGQKYRKSVARLVYYHFVKKFDIEDRNIVISFKDNNSLNTHFSNLEIVSAKERRLKTYASDRARNRKVDYLKSVSQYTVEGNLVANFVSIYEAEKAVGVGCESIQTVIDKEFLTAGGFRWFLQSNPPKKEDFIIPLKSQSPENRFHTFLWEKLGKPIIDPNNPPACMNISIEDLIGEEWKPIPNFEGHFAISNKGRVKHLSGWASGKRKIFLQDKILSQTVLIKNESYFLYTTLLHKRKITRIGTHRLLYHCFVEEFDLDDKTQVVVNRNQPFWEMNISKLSLQSINSVFKRSKNKD